MSDLEPFLTALRRSGLLPPEELAALLPALAEVDNVSPERLANHLVAAGKLSRFQARKLLQGATFGLCLGPYRIQTPLGKGGMGCVYLAVDARSGRHVALKVLPPKRARAKEQLLARFQREMAMGQRVSHPHLAKTLEAGVWQGVYYIAMEYIPGQSLYRLVTAKGPLSAARAARLFCDVAGALEHAHTMGVIHRDLKPSNIMVTPRDHAKVLDLGLALMEGEEGDLEIVGGKGYVVGSVDYIAPEQTYDSTKIDGRADIYSLGCALYFAVTGAAPFAAVATKDKVNAHRHQTPPPLQKRNAAIPDDFAAFVHRMMARRPEDRPPTMSAVRDTLKTWRKSEEIQPLEQEGDSTFQRALEDLADSPLDDAIEDFPIARADGNATDGPATSADMLALAEIEQRLREMRKIGYLVAAFCGAMVLLLAIVLLVVLQL